MTRGCVLALLAGALLAGAACRHRVQTDWDADCAGGPRGPEFFRQQPASGDSGTVRGVVVQWRYPDSTLSRSLVNVGDEQALTDSLGRFTLRAPAGRHPMYTRRLGYYARRDTVTVSGDSAVAVRLALRPQGLDGCGSLAVPVTPTRR